MHSERHVHFIIDYTLLISYHTIRQFESRRKKRFVVIVSLGDLN
jgi:hypothetical protein